MFVRSTMSFHFSQVFYIVVLYLPGPFSSTEILTCVNLHCKNAGCTSPRRSMPQLTVDQITKKVLIITY